MTRPIRVLVVDDSLVTRRLVEDSLREVPGITVVGTASNGRVALERLFELAPDVVTLDIEMPELDGLATLQRLKAVRPDVHAIMFSSLTGRAATATLEALTHGAADFVQKPTGAEGGMSSTRERIRSELVPRIQSLCAHRAPTTLPPAPRAQAHRVEVVGIGVSTGGPAALHTLMSALPVLPVPVLVVQHMPPTFTALFAAQLGRVSAMPVAEAATGIPLAPGHVWLAPGDRHLAIRRRGTRLELDVHQGPPECSCRPAVDVLFRSMAALLGNRALSVVLTGMGQDGLRGCEAVHAAGGTVFVQNQASSVVWGMPGAVARAGLAHRVLGLPRLAQAIRDAVGRREESRAQP